MLVRNNWTKKSLLFLILLVQLGFILCFWLIQYELGNDILNINAIKNKLDHSKQQEKHRITFIQSDKQQFSLMKLNRFNFKNESYKKTQEEIGKQKEFLWPKRELDFYVNFISPKTLYNIIENKSLMFEKNATPLWCFREGTQNESTYRNIANDISDVNINNSINVIWQKHCKCLPDWHGRDCGQPEVIWRALMTSKLKMKLQNPTQDKRHRLICMIEGNFLNTDLLEIQIKTIENSVDFFIIYWKRPKILIKNLKSLKLFLKQILIKRNYALYVCNGVHSGHNAHLSSSPSILSSSHICSSSAAYLLFRRQHLSKNIKSSDYFLYTDDITILGHQALNFLKFYASPITILTPIRFRLKYNVYNFYWQHTNLTYIGGVICSFNFLDNMHSVSGNNGDLNNETEDLMGKLLQSKVQQQYPNNNDKLVIGDLNHLGGWFCKYCQQPEQILQELQMLAATATSIKIKSLNQSIKHSNSAVIVLPRNGHNTYIDVNYVQKLIVSGIYLDDGKTQLKRQQWNWQNQGQNEMRKQLKQRSKQYYAPNYVIEKNWKFGYLLENMYETLDDSLANDYDDN